MVVSLKNWETEREFLLFFFSLAWVGEIAGWTT